MNGSSLPDLRNLPVSTAVTIYKVSTINDRRDLGIYAILAFRFKPRKSCSAQEEIEKKVRAEPRSKEDIALTS